MIKKTLSPKRRERPHLWFLFFDILNEVSDRVFQADDNLAVEAREDTVDLFRIQDTFFDLGFVGQQADERNLYQSEEHTKSAHDDGIGKIEFFSRREGYLHKGRFCKHTNR